MRKFFHEGLVYGLSPGRKDVVATFVQAGSYVVPSDVVCFLGQHNTLAGDEKLKHMFYLEDDLPHAPEIVPVVLSAGEWVITPSRLIGRWSDTLRACQRKVDEWIHGQRRLHRQTLAKLPPPKHSAADLKGKRR